MKIISIGLSLIMALAIIGVEVYYNFCECKNNQAVSLYANDMCCVGEHAVCEIDTNSSAYKLDCCQSVEKQFSLDEVFLIKRYSDIKPLVAHMVLFSFLWENNHIKDDEQETAINKEAPIPLLFGRKLVYFFNAPKMPLPSL